MAPVIGNVTFNPISGILPIGGVIVTTIDADAAGYTLGASTVNDVAVTGFTDNGDTTYTVSCNWGGWKNIGENKFQKV